MTSPPTTQTLVAGLGCRRSCSAEELLTLMNESLDHAGIALSEIQALASIDSKRAEPGLIRLAQQLKLPFEVFSAQQLATFAPRLSHQSPVSYAHTGCFGVAESAALALCERVTGQRATLRVTRQTSDNATFALATGL